MSFYEGKEEMIIERLKAAHDPTKAIIRDQVKQAEYKFFREYIRDQKVLVCGSGLGHDSFELASYNEAVVGYELLEKLVDYATQERIRLKLNNVLFMHIDLLKISFGDRLLLSDFLDTAVMNMGTMCNFDLAEQREIIELVVGLVKTHTFFFSFYPPNPKALKIRKQMYDEESWNEISLHGTTFSNPDGMYSHSYTKQHFRKIADELGFKIKFHYLLDFVIMAEVTK